MKHYFETKHNKNHSQPKKLAIVLHGSGADEMDLVPLVTHILPHHDILSLRGNVIDRGTRRFFSWPINGEFNQTEITQNAAQIADFLTERLSNYDSHVFIGYSNGANMIGALLQTYPQLVSHAILLHPLQVLHESAKLNANVFITYGTQDTMITPAQTTAYISYLTEQGATVTPFVFSGGHEISQAEVDKLREIGENL